MNTTAGTHVSDLPFLPNQRDLVHPGRPSDKGGLHGFWRRIDNKFMKPLFGGSSINSPTSGDEGNGVGDDVVIVEDQRHYESSEYVSRRNMVELANSDYTSTRSYQG